MDLTYATIVVLASMMFVLSGMVGYLYWLQTRLHQNVQSLGLVVSSLVHPPETEQAESEEPVQTAEVPVKDDDEDDRVSVEQVAGPPAETATEEALDLDELHSKTKAQLHEILKEKGIPYSKSDSKTALIEILKATA